MSTARIVVQCHCGYLKDFWHDCPQDLRRWSESGEGSEVSGNSFVGAKAYMDVVRYDEVDRLFKEVLKLQDDLLSQDSGDEWWHKYEDRPLTHNEVYRRALADVMNLLDERMGVLSE